MPHRALGDRSVSAIGMGAMTLTQVASKEVRSGVRAVHAALECGITLFDTADSYGPTEEMGVNERALIAALQQRPRALERVIVATKGGHTRGPNGTWWVDGSPKHLAAAARASAKRLKLESLPLYQLHRPDVKVPFEESMGAMRQLVDEGVVMRLGISNVDVEQVETAIRIAGDALVCVQNEYSPLMREHESVLRLCERRGLAFLAWGPFGGMRAAKGLAEVAPEFATTASRHGVSVQRATLAWLLSLSPNMIPLPGASRSESVRDSAAAVDLKLSAQELGALNATA